MYSMPVRTVCTFDVAGDHVRRRCCPVVESSQPGTTIGRFFSAGGQHPAVLRVDLVVLLQHAGQQHAVHELVREVALAGSGRPRPFVHQRLLEPAHRLLFGDAGIGDAVHVPVQQGQLVGGVRSR
jgi:hypothetical protein